MSEVTSVAGDGLTAGYAAVVWNSPASSGDRPTVAILDQTRLPHVVEVVVARSWETVASAIRTMQVRGAPAIGIAAAMGVALAAYEAPDNSSRLHAFVEDACTDLATTRPTAVNLFWAIDRMRRCLSALRARGAGAEECRRVVEAEALSIAREDEASCHAIGAHGMSLFSAGDGVLTHCNAGALATGAWGTALAPIFLSHRAGVRLHVFVDETRPFMQGARLTAWELMEAGIDSTLITDNMAAHFMGQGAIQKVIVGADRIAANGDVANKIGTYGVAIIAREHGIPVYVAAPTSTVDLSLATGREIPIEMRDPSEVTSFRGQPVAPTGMHALHPAFDVTPAKYVSAIITEVGIHYPPFGPALASAVAYTQVREAGAGVQFPTSHRP